MIKNRIIPAFVLAGLVGVAACERQEETRIETTPTTTETPAPATTDPMMTDPMMRDTLHQDTLHGVHTMPGDTL